MRMSHEFLAKRPIDLYGMHVFELVATLGSFTRASEMAGLSQSAVTRQIQGIEDRLGAQLFERTTRKVHLTDAGKHLLIEARKLNSSLDDSLRRFQETHVDGQKTLRVGFSRTIGLASLPGFLTPFHRGSPKVRLQVSHDTSEKLEQALQEHRLDIAVIASPNRISSALEIRHRFADEFELIVSAQHNLPPGKAPYSPKVIASWLNTVPWIALSEGSNTGKGIRHWLKEEQIKVLPSMELDNFEIIIHLVAMGLGASMVPRRALAAYPRKHALLRMPLKHRFEREVVMLTRRQHTLPQQVQDLIESVLFS